MLFNSLEFAIFLPVVFLIYWFVLNKDLKLQNFFLFVVSYIFYGWWDWRFLSLIVFSSFVDYFIGVQLGKTEDKKKRKLLLLTSLFVNLGFLGFFKYYNFFVESFIDAFSFFGYHFSARTLKIVLPVGISFYTFQTLSYSIDVYRKQLKPTKDIIAFFAFVSFFPQLVAGPIERATNLLPQFYKKRTFNYVLAADGMRQILLGLFKKIVIADNAAFFVDEIFANYQEHSGFTLLLGAFYFAFQIYGDFSGYSDIAIGTAKLFGFDLMRNFAYPYFSRDIAEFWRRWHISLSTWFRDYVYIPLGGSRGSQWKKIRNVFVIFLVSGFWHGANWTFIIWGGLNALYFLPLLLLKRNRSNLDVVAKGKVFPSLRELYQMGTTFLITVLAWVFFRADNVGQAFDYLSGIFSPGFFKLETGTGPKLMLPLIASLVIFEWWRRDEQHALYLDNVKLPRFVRWGLYYSIIAAIMYFGTDKHAFIYFQF